MGLIEQVEQIRNAYPAGVDVSEWEREYGHRDEFSPPEYGEYIATSNDVYSLVTLRARLLGSLKLRAYRGDDQDKIEATGGRTVDLLRHVNPFWTWSRMIRMTEQSMGLWGEGFWAVERKGLMPQELWWLKSDRVTPVPHPDRYLAGFIYNPIDGSEPITFRADEIIWFRYPNPIDEWAGLSPLAAARLAADTSSAMMTSNRNLFSNGMQPGAIVAPATDKVSFSREQAEELERDLERRFKGVDKAHRWSVLRFEASIQQPISPKDAEFVAGLNMTFRQACRAYGVPSPLLNDLEHATLANVREFQKALWEHALVPDAKFYADELVEQLLPMLGRGEPDHLEFDFSTVPALQESASAVWDRDRQAIEVGALKINEWRKRNGLPEVPWGDVFWAPVNKAPVNGPEAPQASDEQRAQATLQALLADSFDQFERQLATLTNGHH